MTNTKNNRLSPLMINRFLRMEWNTRNDSWRELLRKIAGIDHVPDGTLAWCAKFEKDNLLKNIPDIEYYIDTMCYYCANELKRHNKLNEKNFTENMIYGMNMAVLHEMIHAFGEVQNERIVDILTDKIMVNSFMAWNWIECPKLHKNVTWAECLKCKDNEKHESCPFRNVRIDMLPREYERDIYHVTELTYILKSYYNRLDPYTDKWENQYDMLYGKALGYYLEGLHKQHCHEVELKLLDPLKEFNYVVGHVDLVLDEAKRLIELKFYMSLSKMLKTGKPNIEHDFQVKAYYSMGLKHKPWLFKRLNRATIVYYSKMKDYRGKSPRRKEFDVEMVDITDEILRRARILHKALATKTPPLDNRCPRWLCRFCKHIICPYHPSGKLETPKS